MFPTTDEFGGYSSRLRITTETLVQSQSLEMDLKEEDSQFEKNLCELLGIDIEAKALEIVNQDKSFRNLS